MQFVRLEVWRIDHKSTYYYLLLSAKISQKYAFSQRYNSIQIDRYFDLRLFATKAIPTYFLRSKKNASINFTTEKQLTLPSSRFKILSPIAAPSSIWMRRAKNCQDIGPCDLLALHGGPTSYVSVWSPKQSGRTGGLLAINQGFLKCCSRTC